MDVQKLLMRYSSSTSVNKLTESEINLLLELSHAHAPSLGIFLNFINDGSCICPAPYRRFLSDISKSYPVSAIFTPNKEVTKLMTDLFANCNLR